MCKARDPLLGVTRQWVMDSMQAKIDKTT
jgi:hypothetical protein